MFVQLVVVVLLFFVDLLPRQLRVIHSLKAWLGVQKCEGGTIPRLHSTKRRENKVGREKDKLPLLFLKTNSHFLLLSSSFHLFLFKNTNTLNTPNALHSLLQHFQHSTSTLYFSILNSLGTLSPLIILITFQLLCQFPRKKINKNTNTMTSAFRYPKTCDKVGFRIDFIVPCVFSRI